MISEILTLFDFQKLNSAIVYNRDFEYNFFGFKVSIEIHTNGNLFECVCQLIKTYDFSRFVIMHTACFEYLNFCNI